MGTMASQITSLTSVYSTVYSGADQSKHQSSASLAFVWGIQRGPVNSPHNKPVTRKMFPFDDVIMRYQLTHYLMYSNYLYMCEISQNTALFMIMSSNGNIFRVTVYLCGEFTGHKGQWRGTLMFSLTCAWINGWVNNREAGVWDAIAPTMTLLCYSRVISIYQYSENQQKPVVDIMDFFAI